MTFVRPAQWASTPLDRTVAIPPPRPKKPGVTIPRWLVAVVCVVILLVGAIGFALGASLRDDGLSNASAPHRDGTSANRAPRIVPSPNSSVLALLVVENADVPTPLGVQLVPDGNIVTGQPTLQLCNSAFPSESLRTERLQVVAVEPQSRALLSTEAVLYTNPAAAMQAFSELRAVTARCADTPIASAVGDPVITTVSGTAPDAAWPQTLTVERLAYSLSTTNQAGRTHKSVVVYLRRGRVMLALFFPMSDEAQPPISGRTTIPGIVSLFTSRIARVPDSVADG